MASQLKKGVVLSYARVVFNALAGLLYTPWLIACIGSSDYGLYTLAISVINMFLLDFGLGSAVSRFLSKYKVEGDWDDAAVFLGIVYRVYFIIDIVILMVLVAGYFLIAAIYANLTVEELRKFQVLYMIVALYSVLSFPMLSFDGILNSEEKFVAWKGLDLLERITNVALIVVFLLLGYGVFALVFTNALTVLVFRCLKFLVIKRSTNVHVRFGVQNSKLTKELVSFSVWTTAVSISQRMIFAIMPSILAALSNSWEIALFGLVVSLEGNFYGVAAALGNVFMTRVSRALVSENAGNQLQVLMTKVGRVQLFILGAIFVGFIGIGRLFVACWVGGEFSMLYACTILVLIPSMIESPEIVGDTAITAAGAMKQKALIYLAMAITNIGTGIFLVGPYGALGGCVSICIAYCVRTIGMNVLYASILNLQIGRFFRDVYGRWPIPAVLTVGFTFAFDWIIAPVGWLGVLIELTVVTVLYLIFTWILFLAPTEKKKMMSFIEMHIGGSKK